VYFVLVFGNPLIFASGGPDDDEKASFESPYSSGEEEVEMEAEMIIPPFH